MKRGPALRQLFLGLAAVAGAGVTWFFNIRFTLEHQGFSLGVFLRECFANHAASSISADILTVVAVFLVWSFFEARRLGMRRWWIYALLTFSVALAFSFPLFLLMRERALHRPDGPLAAPSSENS